MPHNCYIANIATLYHSEETQWSSHLQDDAQSISECDAVLSGDSMAGQDAGPASLDSLHL